MSDYNYTNQPEPVVTIKRPLFSKYTAAYMLALLCTIGAAGFYWYKTINTVAEPVTTEVLDKPLTEVETEIYRESLERTNPEILETNGADETVEIPETAVAAATPETLASMESQHVAPVAFVAPAAATEIELTPLVVENVTQPEAASVAMVSDKAYLEGDVTILDFQIDSQDTSGSAVDFTAVVYSNDASLKRLLVVSGGVIYTLQTEAAAITTLSGKTVNQANLKKNDQVSVKGTKLNGSEVVIAQSITLSGVQEYIIAF